MSVLSRPDISVNCIVQNWAWGAAVDGVNKDVYLTGRDFTLECKRHNREITRADILENWYDQIPNPTTILRNNVEEIIANIRRGHTPEVPEPETKPSGKIVIPASAPYVPKTYQEECLLKWCKPKEAST